MRALHRRGLAAVSTVVCALTLALPSVGMAQDEAEETPSPFCAVLTAEEASVALGVPLTVGSSSATDCSYNTGSYETNLIVYRDYGPLTDEYPREVYPDGVDLEVSGHPAFYSAEDAVLFVDEGVDDRMLVLELFGATPEQIDVQAALEGLAETGLPRLAAVPMPAEPTLEPEPSYFGDDELAALVPATIEGSTVDIETILGADFVAGIDTTDPGIQVSLQLLQEQLAARGKTIDDLSLAFASYPTPTSYGSITAIRVKGTDIATMTQDLLPLLLTQPVDEIVQTPATIGGKAVTIISDAPADAESPAASVDPFLEVVDMYVYPQGEILWFVAADEPGLTELFEQLP